MPRGWETLKKGSDAEPGLLSMLWQLWDLVAEAAEVLSFKSGSRIPIAAYFGTLILAAIVCFTVVIPWRSLCRTTTTTTTTSGKDGKTTDKSSCLIRLLFAAGVVLFALSAWALTWRLILQFIIDHHAQYSSSSSAEDELFSELEEEGEEAAALVPSFFVSAYEDVVVFRTGWVWSQQLLLWVLPACTFLSVESRRLRLRLALPLAVVAAGFLGAISLAFPCFLFATWARWTQPQADTTPSADVSPRARVAILATSCVAFANVLALPATVNVSTAAFVVHLACLHAILAVPTLAVYATRRPGTENTSASFCVPSLRTVYRLQAAAALVSQVLAVAAVVQQPQDARMDAGLAESQPATLGDIFIEGPFHNLCQTSIFLDAVLAPLVAGLLFVLATDRVFGMLYGSWMLLLSPGCMFALYCSRREGQLHAQAQAHALRQQAAEACEGVSPPTPTPTAVSVSGAKKTQ